MILHSTGRLKECLIMCCVGILALGVPEASLLETHQLVVSVLTCKGHECCAKVKS